MTFQLLRFIEPALVLTAAICVRLIANAVMAHRRRVFEAVRLASALAVELRALMEHYQDNLELLAIPGAPPLAGRVQAVFRGNTGRLIGLIGVSSLTPLVAVHANHERIEAVVQLCQKLKDGGPTATELNGIYRARLRERLLAGRDLAAAALGAIEAAWPSLGTADRAPINTATPHDTTRQVPWGGEDLLSAATELL